MPRARNLKHDFFMDDQLAELDPLARILFAGLWCIADYKGDLEWRKAKVKAQTLPYDDCDVESLAINLDKSGFIRFYSDGNKIYVNVRSFLDHQHPHKNEREKGSSIPKYSENMRQLVDLKGLKIIPDLSGVQPSQNGTNRADSFNLIPDSCNPITDSSGSAGAHEPTQPKRFKPPTVEQVRDYCIERGNTVDAERFVDWYTANGWVQGKGKKIKCWKSTVRNWERNEKQNGVRYGKNNKPSGSQLNFDEIDYGVGVNPDGTIQ